VNATAEQATCRSCGAILSRYRAAGEELCAPCARKAVELELPPRVVDPEELVQIVAGMLLLARATDPESRVHLRAELADRGIEVDHVDVHQAIQKLRRRYDMQIDAEERLPGYRLEAWPYKFTRANPSRDPRRYWNRRQIPLFS
jgi:hypothetical protein